MTTSTTTNSDNDSAEGAVARNLFRTDDDSSSSEEEEEVTQNEPCETTASAVDEGQSAFVRYPIMDILLEEQRFGGSIAQRLWPAAEYLARFVMEQKETIDTEANTLSILELGAGVGLTGLQLATQLRCRVLLTDLPEAMPLLERNIELNRDRFVLKWEAVQAQVLSWGDEEHIQKALAWILENDGPILILASDCVYFQELHAPLEQTLRQLLEPLSSTSRTTKCWIAGMRRWKRDNAFYANLGQRTRTATHELTCDCLQETVSRDEDDKREIIRVFSILWQERTSKSRSNTISSMKHQPPS
jgi:hypothetical protein